MFSRNALTLAISDAVLVGSTVFSVFFVKAVQKGWIRYYYTGVIIHHTFQTLMLACAITWTFNRRWYWVQSGFFTLHSLVMIMKVHSYCAVNGYLSWVSRRATKLQKELEVAATEATGSYEAALAAAAANKPATPGTNDASGAGTPSVDGHVVMSGDSVLANALRKRLNGSANGTPFAGAPLDAHTHEEHPLAHHPDAKVSQLAEKLSECESELTSDGPARVRWPANVGFAKFADYQLIPTLVYELEYPRTDRCAVSPGRVWTLMGTGYGRCTCSRRPSRRWARLRCCTPSPST